MLTSCDVSSGNLSAHGDYRGFGRIFSGVGALFATLPLLASGPRSIPWPLVAFGASFFVIGLLIGRMREFLRVSETDVLRIQSSAFSSQTTRAPRSVVHRVELVPIAEERRRGDKFALELVLQAEGFPERLRICCSPDEIDARCTLREVAAALRLPAHDALADEVPAQPLLKPKHVTDVSTPDGRRLIIHGTIRPESRQLLWLVTGSMFSTSVLAALLGTQLLHGWIGVVPPLFVLVPALWLLGWGIAKIFEREEITLEPNRIRVERRLGPRRRGFTLDRADIELVQVRTGQSHLNGVSLMSECHVRSVGSGLDRAGLHWLREQLDPRPLPAPSNVNPLPANSESGYVPRH